MMAQPVIQNMYIILQILQWKFGSCYPPTDPGVTLQQATVDPISK